MLISFGGNSDDALVNSSGVFPELNIKEDEQGAKCHSLKMQLRIIRNWSTHYLSDWTFFESLSLK